MADENTILDAFVKVSVDPDSPVKQQLQDMLAKLQGEFGKGIGRSLAVGGGARKELSELRTELLRFQKDVANVRINVRLAGDKDIARQFADIQNRVQEQQKRFALAPSGKTGLAERTDAIREIARQRAELEKLQLSILVQSGASGQLTAGETLEKQIFAAKVQAAQLKQEMQEVNRVISTAKDGGLTENFRRAREEVNRILLSLTQATQQRDILGIENSIAALQSFENVFERIRNQANAKISIDADFSDLNAKFKNTMALLQADLKELSTLNSNQLTRTDRTQLAAMQKEMQILKIEAEGLNNELNKTPEVLERLGKAQFRMTQLAEGMKTVYQGTRLVNGGMGNLNNNMYQLGQAIEDFSIGFQLNGLQGGIRGASNNVSFLLNNLSHSLQRSGQLNATWANAISLLSGVGAAVAILVLPRLAEWIQSLNQIEALTVDISEKVKRLIQDADLEIEINLNATGFRRATEEAKGFSEILDLLNEKAKEADKLQFTVLENLRVVNTDEINTQIDRLFIQIKRATEDHIKELEEAINKPIIVQLPGGRGEFSLPPSPELIQERTKEFQIFKKFFGEGLEDLQAASGRLRGQRIQGIVDPDTLTQVRDGIRGIVDNAESLEKTGLLTKKEFEVIGKVLAVILPNYEDLVGEAERFQRINDQINNHTLNQALHKLSQITAEYKFQQDINAGRRFQEEQLLHEHEQQTAELKNQLKLFRELREAQGAPEATIKGVENAAKQTNLIQQRIDLERRINELLEQRKEERPKSRAGSPEEFVKLAFTNEKNEDALNRELRLLREALDRNRKSVEEETRATEKGGFAERLAEQAREKSPEGQTTATPPEPPKVPPVVKLDPQDVQELKSADAIEKGFKRLTIEEKREIRRKRREDALEFRRLQSQMMRGEPEQEDKSRFFGESRPDIRTQLEEENANAKIADEILKDGRTLRYEQQREDARAADEQRKQRRKEAEEQSASIHKERAAAKAERERKYDEQRKDAKVVAGIEADYRKKQLDAFKKAEEERKRLLQDRRQRTLIGASKEIQEKTRKFEEDQLNRKADAAEKLSKEIQEKTKQMEYDILNPREAAAKRLSKEIQEKTRKFEEDSLKRKEEEENRGKFRRPVFDERQNIRPRATLEEIQDLRRQSEFDERQNLQRRRQSGISEETQKMIEDIIKAREAAKEAGKMFIELGSMGSQFSSETLEKLIETSNKTLTSINQSISELDMTARAS